MHRFNTKQRGQAMVESVVGLSYVIVPLLILLPFMSKLTGVQHRAEQASHYSAWERTVWKNRQPSQLPRRSGIYLARKSEADLARQIPWRFYQQDGQQIKSSTNDQWDWSEHVHPLVEHQVQQGAAQGLQPLVSSNQDNPNNSNELDRFTRSSNGSRLPGVLNGATSTALGVISFMGFSLERDQFYRTNVSTQVENFYIEPFDELDLNFSSQSALLASGWNAAGPYHVKNRTRKLVLTNVMDNGVIRTAQRLMGILPFGKDLRPSSLKLGHVSPDVLPTNRLCTYGTANCGG